MPDPIPHEIFISYRRADHGDFVDRIRDWLVNQYGHDKVFIDSESIPLFVAFDEFIEEHITIADAVIVIIGPRWVELMQERVSSGEEDYVLFEVSTALRLNKAIAPILIKGGIMPKAAELPENLRSLSRINAPSLDSGNTFSANIEKIINGIENVLRRRNSPAIQTNSIVSGTQIDLQNARLLSDLTTKSPTTSRGLNRFLENLFDRLKILNPNLEGKEGDELLVTALNATIPFLAEYYQVVEALSGSDMSVSVSALTKFFEKILAEYQPPQGFSGAFNDAQFDFFKFLGHELFVGTVAIFIREEKWDFIGELLAQQLYVPNHSNGDLISFDEISDFVWWLRYRNDRLQARRVSIHADMLNERYTKSPLMEFVVFQDFIDADYFLYLRGEIDRAGDSFSIEWRAWSVLYMKRIPQFLVRAISVRYAHRVAIGLGLREIEELKQRLEIYRYGIAKLYRSSSSFFRLPTIDIDQIGTKP